MLLNSNQLFQSVYSKADKIFKHFLLLFLTIVAHPAFTAIQYSCLSEDCGGLCYQFTSPFPSTTNNWDFGDGETGTGVTVKHCYTNVNTYTGTNNTAVVKLNATGQAQQGVTITHSSCQNGIFIGAVNGSTTNLTAYNAVLPGFTFDGSSNTQDIYVYAVVWIDKNFTFSETSLFFQPRAGFNVGNIHTLPTTLTLLDHTFMGVKSGCDYMWRGIEVSSGGSVVSDGTGAVVTIKDALYGIATRSLNSLDIERTDFINNYIGIMCFRAPTLDLHLANSNFNSSGTLLSWLGTDGGLLNDPFYPSNDNYSNSRGWAGIYIEGTRTSSIGEGNSDINNFKNLANGIFLRSSSVGVLSGGIISGGIVGCTFSEIHRGGYGADIAGNGIRFLESPHMGNFMRQVGTGLGNTSNPSFDDCEVGINSLTVNKGGITNIVSLNNRMDNMETGYRISNPTGTAKVDINNNYVNSNQYLGNSNMGAFGIFVDIASQNATTDINISDNVVSVDQDDVAGGIRIDKNYLDMSTDGNIVVSGNVVTIEDGGVGIFGYSTGGMIIKENEVNKLVDATGGELGGILLFSGFDNDILCNDIYGPEPVTLGVSSGISVINDINPKILNNHVTDFNISLDVAQDCGTAADIGCNDFLGDNNYALYYEYDAMTGSQYDKGNVFNCNSVEAEARSDAYNFTNELYSALIGTLAYPDGPQPAAFFQPSLNPTPPTCPTDPACELTAVVYKKTSTDFAIANDTLSVSPGTLSSARLNLYRKLVEQDSLLDGDTLMQNFVDVHENGPVGQFYTIRKRINELIKVPTDLQDEYDDNLERIQVRLETIDSCLAILDTVTYWALVYDTLQDRIDRLSGDIEGFYDANVEILDSMQSLRVLLSDSLSVLNGAVYAVETFDVNQQKVFDIFLSTIAIGNFTATNAQLDTLENIAAQCPSEGGRAVLEAIHLHQLFTGSDLPLNDCVEERSSKLLQPTGEVQFTLAPNPTTGTCTVNYRLKKGQKGEINVWNGFGELKVKYSIDDRSRQTIKIEDLSSGIYFVQLLVEGKLVGTQKLIKL